MRIGDGNGLLRMRLSLGLSGRGPRDPSDWDLVGVVSRVVGGDVER